MKPLAFDTNVLIDMLERGTVPKDVFGSYDRLLISSVVIGEYRAGLESSRRGRSMLAKLLNYISKVSVDVVPVTERTAELYAKVFQALRERGRPIPQNDMWIAASALEHGADLATTDEHFRSVPLLTTIVLPPLFGD